MGANDGWRGFFLFIKNISMLERDNPFCHVRAREELDLY
jgi:hypothetical protein